MGFSQFAAAVLVAYIGLTVGVFLASMTKEELPTARKYFPLLQKLAIITIAAFALDYFAAGVATRTASYIVLLFLLLFHLAVPLYYAAFGFLAFAVSAIPEALLVISSLVFLFGMLTGSASFPERLKKGDALQAARELLARNALYPAAAMVTYFISVYV